MLPVLLISVALIAVSIAAIVWRLIAFVGRGHASAGVRESLSAPVAAGSTRPDSDVAALMPRRWRRMVKTCCLALVGSIVLLISARYATTSGPWTSRLPRLLMRAALAVADPPPSPPRTPGGLATPNAALRSSPSAWDRCVWQHQLSQVMESWAGAVLASKGPITPDDLTRLAPMAEHMHALFQQYGHLSQVEAWVPDRTRERLVVARHEARGDPDRLARLDWILSELQFNGSFPAFRDDFARCPDAVLNMALTHPDPKVRLFGLDRFANRVHEVVMDRRLPMPPGRVLVESIAKSDADPAVRQSALRIVDYAAGFLTD